MVALAVLLFLWVIVAPLLALVVAVRARDRAAAAIASALGAIVMVILSNVPGLLQDPSDESSLVSRIERGHVQSYVERYARGSMKRKLLGALEALDEGVGQVILADGRVAQPLQQALAGHGTVIA